MSAAVGQKLSDGAYILVLPSYPQRYFHGGQPGGDCSVAFGFFAGEFFMDLRPFQARFQAAVARVHCFKRRLRQLVAGRQVTDARQR